MRSTVRTTDHTSTSAAGNRPVFARLTADTRGLWLLLCVALTGVWSQQAQAQCVPSYASFPYSESFESWVNCGSTSDAPGASWRGTPATGNASWRRYDQQATASWTSANTGPFSPTFTVGTMCARFHSSIANTTASVGQLDLFINCSTGAPNKRVSFDYLNNSGADVLKVFLSTDAGATFTQLGATLTTTGGTGRWDNKGFPFTSTSATTVIRLEATGGSTTNDIGVDNLYVGPTCSATYAPLPFAEGFESWANCNVTTDVPGVNWQTRPSTGFNAWRRHDQGSSANWSTTSGIYTPAFSQGASSARFHTNDAASTTTGAMDLYLDCSAGAASKTLTFDHINTSGSDVLRVYLSTDAGATFTQLGSNFTTAANWTPRLLNFSSTSATTVIRFEATSDFGTTDIGIDNINVSLPCTPVYAAFPYTQDFESWTNCGAASDVPSLNFTNTPASGNNSWRRNDQGSSASWVNATNGIYSPTFSTGVYSARFHSYQAANGLVGNLDLRINCSTGPAAKRLTFDHINTSGTDVLAVLLSTDGGTTFTSLSGNIGTNAAWTNLSYAFTSTSATTVLRFQATSDFGTTDIGIDNLFVNDPASAPVCASLLSPANAATGVAYAPAPVLSWAAAANATGYDVYLGTNASSLSLVSSNQAATSYTAVNLLGNTTYHWRIVPRSINGTTTGCPTWSFTTQPVANDLCAGALPLACGGSVSGNTTPASDDIIPNCTSSSGNNFRGVWYTITPAAGQLVTLSLCGGASWDTYLRVFEGSCASLVCKTSNDDGCTSTNASQLSFTSTGATYYVLVSGYNSAAFGAFTLTATCVSLPTCVASPSAPANGAAGIAHGAPTTLSWPAVANATGYDVYLGTSVGGMSLATTNQSGTSYTTAALQSNTTYYWRVVPRNSAGVATGCANFSFSTTSIANDVCSGAIPVACGASVSGNTTYASDDVISTCGITGTGHNFRGLWHSIATTSGQTVTLSLCSGTNFDSYLRVYEGSCGSLVCVGGDDDFCNSQSQVTFTANGGTYYILVTGYNSSDYGAYTLAATCAVPAYNPCASITPIPASGVNMVANFPGGGGAGWNNSGCGFTTDGQEFIYSFTPTISGIHYLEVTSGTGGYVDYSFKPASAGCNANSWSCIGDVASSDMIAFGPLTAGTPYYILLDAEGTGVRTQNFHLLAPNACPEQTLTAGCNPVSVTASTANALDDCSFYSGYDRTYAIVLPYAGTWDINTCGAATNFDTRLYLSSACCSGQISVNDDNCGLSSRILYTGGPGTVYIDVEGYLGDTGTFVLTVLDMTPPTAVCANQFVTLDANGIAAVAAEDFDGGSSSVCGINGIVVSQTDFTCADVPNRVVVVTVTGGNGLVDTCQAHVNVADQLAPVAVCANLTVALDANGQAAITAEDLDGGSSDNCGITSIVASQTSFTCADIPNAAVTLTVTDGSGNAATCTSTITVQDVTPPTAVCNSATVYLDETGFVQVEPLDLVTASTDNCAIDTATGNCTFFCSDIGANPRVITVIDVNGNTATCTSTVTVLDTIAPTAVCMDMSVTLDGSGQASIIAEDLDGGSGDNCGIVSITASQSDFSCADAPGVAVTMTFTDASGNSSTCIANVTVQDVTPPTAICNDTTVYLDETGFVQVEPLDLVTASTDNCAIDTATGNCTFFCSDLGANPRVITVIDVNGNIATCTSTVTVLDTIAPTAVCMDMSVTLDGSGQASIIAEDLDGGSGDNCGIVSITASQTDFSCADAPGVAVTMTFTDASGNSSTCTANVTVIDDLEPVITCPANISVGTSPGICGAVVNYTVTATDNCSAQVTVNPASGSTFSIGTTTVDATATDPSGNSATCSFTVTVTDNEAPAITCPANISVNTAAGTCAATVTYAASVGTDNCPGATTVQTAGLPSGSSFPIGTTTNTFNVTAANGQTASCSFTVTVIDNQAPVISCPAAITVCAVPGTGTAPVTFASATATDNCPGVTVAQIAGPASGSNFNVGNTTVTFRATDAGGLTANCSFTVTVNQFSIFGAVFTESLGTINTTTTIAAHEAANGFDNDGYTMGGSGNITNTQSSSTFYPLATGGANASLGSLGQTFEISGINTLGYSAMTMGFGLYKSSTTSNGTELLVSVSTNGTTYTPLAFTPRPTGTGTNRWYYTNAFGSIPATANLRIRFTNASATTQFRVDDIILIGNTTTANISASRPLSFCNGDSTRLAVGPASSFLWSNGETTQSILVTTAGTYSVTVTGANGCQAIAPAVTVTVFPNPAVTATSVNATCPGVSNGSATAVGAGGTGPYTYLWTPGGQTSATASNLGAGTYSVVAIDANGCTSSPATVTITDTDTVPPVAVCANTNIVLDANGNAVIAAEDLDGGSTDNCGIASIVVSQTDFDCANVGVNSVTLTVTDQSGNSSTCTANVTVQDVTPPTAVCNDATVYLDETGFVQVEPLDLVTASTDNCAIDTATGNCTFFCSEIGPNPRVITVIDVNGNIATCTSTVTVLDTIAPTAVCMDMSVTLDGSGQASIIAEDLDGGSGDNCGIVSISASQTDFGCADAPSAAVTMTFTDASGNSSNCIANVTVIDDLEPVITCPADISVGTSPGICGAVVNYNVTATDNCSAQVTVNPASGSTFNIGTTTVNATATDPSGNSATCSFTVTVTDDDAPVAVCNNITVSLDASGNAVIAAEDIDGGSSDNCGIASIVASQTSFTCANTQSGVVVTLTVTDAAGNVSTCTANVTVIDNLPPTAVCNDATVYLDATGFVQVEPLDLVTASTDNCAIDTATGNCTFFCSDIGANPRVITVIDVNGNIATCTSTVTVLDSIAPVAVCVDQNLTLDANGQVSIVAEDLDGGSGDNCAIASIVASQTDFDCANVGVNSVTLTVTDQSGNVSTCVATVTITDDIAPVITRPANISVGTDATFCGAIVNYNVNATDNCSAQVTVSPASGSTFNVGTTTVNATATDPSGNSATCSFTVTVTDDDAPAAICQDIVVQLDANGLASITAAQIDNGSTDNCAIASISINQSDFSCADVGGAAPTDLFISEYVEALFNTKCIEIYNGTGAPINLAAGGYAIQMYFNGSNSPGTTVQLTGTIAAGATYTVCTANSTAPFLAAANQTSSASWFNGNDAVVLAKGGVAIDIFGTIGQDPGNAGWTAPGYQTMDRTLRRNPSVITGLTTSVPGFPTLATQWTSFAVNTSSGLGSHSVTLSGTNPVVLTVTDVNGNVSTCTGNVTVQDLVAPNAICQDLTVQLDANGNASITAGQINNGSTDACGIVNITATPTTFACADVPGDGPTDLIISEYVEALFNTKCIEIYNGTGAAIDLAAGGYVLQMYFNGSSTVGNTVALTGTVAAGATYTVCTSNSTSPFLAVANQTSNSSWFNGNDAVVLAKANGATRLDIFGRIGQDPGNVGWTAAGGYQTADRTLRRNPNIARGITVNPAAGFPTLGTEWTVFGVNNSTGTGSHVFTGSGTNTVVLTVTDVNGNSSTCTAEVTVQDVTAPIALCQNVSVSLDASGVATITAASIDGGSSDNCGIASIVASQTSFTCANTGANTVTLTVTDIYGNVSTCTAIVTVIDNTDPVITCPADITVGTDAGLCGAVVTFNVNATDNCSAQVSVSLASGSTFVVGTTTVTATATDPSGNSATCSFTVTVNDDDAPAAVCQNISITLDASGNAVIVAEDLDGGSSDNCGIASIVASQTSFTCAHVGPNTVTLTVTDVNGNVSTCTAIVTVVDNTNPVITCPADITVGTDAGLCSAVVTFNVNATDNCSAQVTVSPASGSTFVVGTTTVTATATDPSGNSATCSFTVTVNDDDAPAAVCQNISITLDASGNAVIVAEDLDGGSSDNCGIAGIVASQTSFTCAHVGPNTVVLTVTDVNGNVSTCTGIVTVIDNTNPVITCPGNITVGTDAGLCGAVVNYNVNATDNCSAQVTVSPAGGSTFVVGTTTVTATATDPSGNSVTCSFTVTVNDDDAPAAVCQNISVTLDASGNAVITAEDLDGGSSDNCGIASIVASQTSFTCAHVGPNTVTLTVTDVNGNVSTCTAIVTVIDNTDPVITCPADITVGTDAGLCGAVVNYNVNATDNCSAQVSVSPASGSVFTVGTTTVTATATDPSGNTATCSFTVTVNDDDAPAAVCQNISVTLDASGNAAIVAEDLDGGSSDNCGIASIVASQTSFTCAHVGPNTVSLTVTDVNGNISSCTAIVTVIDNTNPVITCPADITVGTDAGLCGAVVNYNVNATDNCSAQVTVSPASGSTFVVGTTTVTATATDPSGNSATCSFTVTVNDDDAPAVVCQNISVTLDASGNAVIVAEDLDGGSSDNCGIASIVASQTSFTCAHVGPNTVTLTVTDVNGNVSTCTAIVTVIDNTDPVITCPADITVGTDAPNCSAVVNYNVTATDNCSAQVSVNPASGSVFTVGTTTVTATATDPSGNTATCSFTVTVNDDDAPSAVCQNATVSLGSNGTVTITSSTINNGSSDNCGIASLVASQTSFTCANIGPNTVALTVTDNAGNVSTCSAVVTVVDNSAPVITCPANITVAAPAGQCSTAVNYNVSATDNCSATVSVSPASGSIFVIGTTTVTATATDPSGNTAICSFTVTVSGNGSLTFTGIPADLTLSCGSAIPAPPAIVPCGGGTIHTGDFRTQTQGGWGANCNGNNPGCYRDANFVAAFPNGLTIGCTANRTLRLTSAAAVNTFLPCGGTPAVLSTSYINPGCISNTFASQLIAASLSVGFDNANPNYSASSVSLGSLVVASGPLAGLTVNQVIAQANSLIGGCGSSYTVSQLNTALDNINNNFVDGSANNGFLVLPGGGAGGGGISATSACGPCPVVTFSEMTVAGNCAGNYTIIRTWTATSGGTVVGTATQTITVVDNVAPVITCPANITVAAAQGQSGAVVNFNATATDNCSGATVTYSIAPGSVFPVGTTTVTATATDGCGNASTCTFTVTVTGCAITFTGIPANLTLACGAAVPAAPAIVPCGGGNGGSCGSGDFRTQTQGGWGANCNGNNPGCYRDANFAAAFPNGLTIGCSTNRTLRLTTAAAVNTFLPCGGTPAALTQSYVNPNCISNTLAGQLVTATLNVGFDNANPNFSSSPVSLGSLLLASGPMAGLTVNQVIAQANSFIGGCGSNYSASQLNAALTGVNESFDNGNSNTGFLVLPAGGGGVSATSACGPCPTVTMSETTVPVSNGGFTITRTWTATSNGIVVGTATQTITVVCGPSKQGDLSEQGSAQAGDELAAGLELLGIYPVPTDRDLNLNFTSLVEGRVTVQVIDMYGKVVMQSEHAVNAHENLIRLDVSNLPMATYRVKVSNGSESFIKAFVKQ